MIAEELGISPAYLSYMVNGKRPWRKDLYQRDMGVVNSDKEIGNKKERTDGVLGTVHGAGDGIRTHDILLGKQIGTTPTLRQVGDPSMRG